MKVFCRLSKCGSGGDGGEVGCGMLSLLWCEESGGLENDGRVSGERGNDEVEKEDGFWCWSMKSLSLSVVYRM